MRRDNVKIQSKCDPSMKHHLHIVNTFQVVGRLQKAGLLGLLLLVGREWKLREAFLRSPG